MKQTLLTDVTKETTHKLDRWVEEQMFEEDVRAIVRMMRPHRREKLSGWSEYRTGGANFRATISWAPEFEKPGEDLIWRVPRMAEVLETVLVGSLHNSDDLTPQEEFEMYREVARELSRRLDELEECYT